MLDLNAYDEQTLADIRTRLNDCAAAVGGFGRLYALVETILAAKPSPLQNKTASFHYDHGKVSWDKVLFADKVETLAAIVRNHDTMQNLLETASKKERNALRALYPVMIMITPKDGAPYGFKVIEAPDEKTARINPLFELLFFASTGMIKKAIKET